MPFTGWGDDAFGTINELIHGIMSAIDFSMDIARTPDPKGDRVNVVLYGKVLAVEDVLTAEVAAPSI